MTAREWLQTTAAAFQRAGLAEGEGAAAEAGLLLEAVLGEPRLQVMAGGARRTLSEAEEAALGRLAARRLSREPLQFILGRWAFLDLTLEVGPGVLIPRPETEDWVDRLLGSPLVERFGADPALVFADLGTGTGAIGLTLARRWPRSRGILVDISAAALEFTRRNLARHPAEADRLAMVRGDLCGCLRTGAFDLVVGNLPYIDPVDLPGLEPEVRDHEPRVALDGGPGGVDLIRRVLAEVGRVVRPGGLVALEHGHGQRAVLQRLPAPDLALRAAFDDAAGRERCLVWERRPS
ncbi:MAG: Protein-N(5)-glutamine methyltransferase PrmC [Candidatus Ozemobacter sibiricus]|jgi:release factor glutamine methyltransferase|uniref:peptide chain release factor N(5)-glutamine methyltransferase n=1 Tax=Candidatus Ozemobacter sibiricus TaxID=2268124 RepID=A0A367ZQZ5_9BACT|nr:MAG: Protein-N(5)-glutamine methyltransferase PrmC [Candidatus Ozemobacter sibiricus]